MGTNTVSRGRLNIATCLVTGSIDTVMSVSVLWPPSCSSAPIIQQKHFGDLDLYNN